MADKRNLTGRDMQRSSERRAVALPARLTWKDASGAVRFISVMTRDVSDAGVFVECDAGAAIPLYRLVHLQVERVDPRGRSAAGALARRPRAVGGVARRAVPAFDRHAIRVRPALPGRAADVGGSAALAPLEAIAV